MEQISESKPRVRYANHGVDVLTKYCQYRPKRVNPWLEVWYQFHRPWYAPWNKCVGFFVYCPSILRLSGTISVTNVLDLVAGEVSPHQPFGGKYRALVYRLAKGLRVQFPAQNS